MADDALLHVEVVYALSDEQVTVALEMPAGSSVGDALARSELPARFPEIGSGAKLGIFGRLVAADTPLAAGDRVEIYRPLQADPKQARRRRAAAGKP